MGWTAAARRSVSAPTSDSPIWRTYPAFTRSANGADRFLDRYLRIEPRRPVDVDMVDAEALQRGQATKFFTAAGRPSKPDQPPAGSRSAPNFTLSREAVARH